MMASEKESLPARIEVETASGTVIALEREIVKQEMSGLSPKSRYTAHQHKKGITFQEESNADIYFGKMSKPRDLAKLFSSSVSPTIFKSPSPALEKHKKELAENHAFHEVLVPCVVNAIFNQSKVFVAVPENYYYLCPVATHFDSKDTFPLVLSKCLPRFDEFLSRDITVQGKKLPNDHLHLITRNEIKLLNDKKNVSNGFQPLSCEQAEVIGKLFFIALLIGHWDVLNNINLTNSGSVTTEEGKLIPAIVDWGNAMGVGFEGLSADQTAFKNPDFPSGVNSLRGINGFEHTIPFDKIVYPVLPRQLVSDLFDMDGDDELSKATLKGFKAAYEQAAKSKDELDNLIPNAIKNALDNYTSVKDADYVRLNLLTPSIYFPEGKQKSGYTLINTLKGRIDSLGGIIQELECKTLKQIADERLKQIIDSQKAKNESEALKTCSLFKEVLNPKQSSVVVPLKSLGEASKETVHTGSSVCSTFGLLSSKIPNEVQEELKRPNNFLKVS